jgi:hypothetical protein
MNFREAQGFGVARIVLRRLDLGFDTWWRDQPHLVTLRAKASGPVVGTPTRFHTNQCRGERGDKGQQRTTRKTLPDHHVPRVIHADDVKHEFRDIDAKDADFPYHRTRLLLVNG